MQWIYARSREREIAWKIGAIILGSSFALSPFVMMIFEKYWGFRTVCPSSALPQTSALC